VTALVRESDLPRYYAALFAPPAIRDDLLSIYGFAVEIARIPRQVSEPTLGEIRLRWWSDALVEAIGRGGGGETPALRAAAGAITRLALPIAPFSALIEARSADLYADSPTTLTDLEGRTGETESVLFQMTAVAFGAAGPETADAAGHAGVAYGVARRLSAFASDQRRGRSILPAELLSAKGIAAEEVFSPSARPRLHVAVGALAEAARSHLDHARRHVASVPATLRPAFLPLAVVAPLLSQIERLGPAIAEKDVRLSNLESLTRIAWARMRGLGRGKAD
jgi:15-cis-phytoene synthase